MYKCEYEYFIITDYQYYNYLIYVISNELIKIMMRLGMNIKI